MSPAAPLPTRSFARLGESLPVPDLTRWHRRAYERLFEPGKGFDAVLRETFPIRAHEGDVVLHFERLELGEPEHDLEACRRLGCSYARPLFAWLRLEGKERVSQRVELARVPILCGGEYLINGSERVVIGQLTRAPGIDFAAEDDPADVSCRIRPEYGARVDIAIGRHGTLEASLGANITLPALTLLRALSPELASDSAILHRLHPTRSAQPDATLIGAVVAEDVIHPSSAEVLLDAGGRLTEAVLDHLLACSFGPVVVLEGEPDDLLLDSLAQEQPRTQELAVLAVYRLLRKGMPAHLDRARQALRERFADPARFHLGRAGRARIERKFGATNPTPPSPPSPKRRGGEQEGTGSPPLLLGEGGLGWGQTP